MPVSQNQSGSTGHPYLKPVGFADLPGWDSDDHLAAFRCFLRFLQPPAINARSPRVSTTASLAVAPHVLSQILQDASTAAICSGDGAKAFFEDRFRPALVVDPSRRAGFVTGYFEPALPASRVRTRRFRYPLYAVPDDLAGADPDIMPYHDREAIRLGALEGRRLELAWLDNPVDQFLVHVQGSVKLELDGGETMRLSFAAKNGHPYTSIGALLIEAGEIAQGDMTMSVLRQWLLDNPGKCDQVMDQNRSYVFFQPFVGADQQAGPTGASGVALCPGRSIAIDPQFHGYGTPVFVATDKPLQPDEAPFRRLMIAHDTGSAITGPARGDLFMGSGKRAGELAGVIRHDARFYVLLPDNAGMVAS